MFLAGSSEAIDGFFEWLHQDSRFADVRWKESYSEKQPFNRMLVRLKREIITMKHPLIKPELGRAPVVTAPVLKRWLDQGHDDHGREVVLLDTRNSFEVRHGSFRGAVDFGIGKFSDFPQAFRDHAEALKEKTIVSFCTGGIRCEKAAIYMQQLGHANALQLEGGILNYFEKTDARHYVGDCFVFDDRELLNPQLAVSSHAK